jgi:hypothetical protein
MSIDETQARRFHDVYTKHFHVFYPLAQQFPTWEQLSERERALLGVTCKEMATTEAEMLVSLLNCYKIELEKLIEKRLKDLGFLLCSQWERNCVHYSLSTPDPELWKEPTNNVS